MNNKYLFGGYVFLLTLLPVAVYSQITPSIQDTDLANRLGEKYKKASAAILKADSRFEFYLDKKTKTPHVREIETLEFISLRSNHEIITYEMYDDQSEIEKVSFSNVKNKTIALPSVCGNYDVDDVFYSDAKICRFKIDFLTKGERKTLSIQKDYRDIKYFTSTYFQKEYPIVNRTITFSVPEWLDLELKAMNFEGYSIEKKTVSDSKNKISSYEYTAEHLPDLQREKFQAGSSYTYPHVFLQCKSFELNGTRVPVLNSLSDLYQWYSSLTREVQNDKSVLSPLVQELIKNKKNDEEKVRAIFYWVQDNIRYIAYENGVAGFKPESAHLVYQKKYGDCKGMANLTKLMLGIAGYDARLTWIGTNKIAYDYSTPSLAVDNHMICTLLLNGKKHYLDATEKYCPLYEYGERIQGRQVLIENGEQYILDRVPVSGKEKNQVSTEQEIRMDQLTMKINGKTTLNGEMKTGVLYLLNQTENKQQSEKIKNVLSINNKNTEVARLDYSSIKDRDIPFVASYDLSIKNTVSAFDNDLYINLDQEQEYRDFVIQPERVSAIHFNEKVLKTLRIKLKVPQGYKISSLPNGLSKAHDHFKFAIQYTEKNGEIWYEKQIAIENGVIERKDFPVWNDYIKALKQAYNEKIILTKINP